MSFDKQIKDIEKLELITELEKGINDIENNNVYSTDSIFEEIEKLL